MVNVKPKQVSEWSGRIVDVRNPDEFANERLNRAECVPLSKLMASAASWDRAEPLLVMCKSGMRSRQAVGQLEAAGFTQIHMVEGGIDACKREGLPVIVDRKTIPLFRQVMIAAGLMLLVGLALATWAHPAFIVIDWFVAAGLVVAGTTGLCPMASLLARLPWNRATSCAQGTCS